MLTLNNCQEALPFLGSEVRGLSQFTQTEIIGMLQMIGLDKCLVENIYVRWPVYVLMSDDYKERNRQYKKNSRRRLADVQR